MGPRLRRELQTEVETAHGKYGEFTVTVDDVTVIDGGTTAFLGVLPTRSRQIVPPLAVIKSGP